MSDCPPEFLYSARWAELVQELGWNENDAQVRSFTKVAEARDVDLETYLAVLGCRIGSITFLLPGAVTDEEVGPWVAPTEVTINEVVLGCITAGTTTGATVNIDVNGSTEDTITMGSGATTYTETVDITVEAGDRVTVEATSVDDDLVSLSVGLRWG